MIRHQHVGMNGTPRLGYVLIQPVQVEAVLVIRTKTGLTVISPLNDMHRATWKNDAWATRHKLHQKLHLHNYGAKKPEHLLRLL